MSIFALTPKTNNRNRVRRRCRPISTTFYFSWPRGVPPFFVGPRVSSHYLCLCCVPFLKKLRVDSLVLRAIGPLECLLLKPELVTRHLSLVTFLKCVAATPRRATNRRCRALANVRSTNLESTRVVLTHGLCPLTSEMRDPQLALPVPKSRGALQPACAIARLRGMAQPRPSSRSLVFHR